MAFWMSRAGTLCGIDATRLELLCSSQHGAQLTPGLTPGLQPCASAAWAVAACSAGLPIPYPRGVHEPTRPAEPGLARLPGQDLWLAFQSVQGPSRLSLNL